MARQRAPDVEPFRSSWGELWARFGAQIQAVPPLHGPRPPRRAPAARASRSARMDGASAGRRAKAWGKGDSVTRPGEHELVTLVPAHVARAGARVPRVDAGLPRSEARAAFELRRRAPGARARRAARARAATPLLGGRGHQARVARDARARPGDLPVRGLGARAGRARLPRRARRERPADAPGASRPARARRGGRAPLPHARPARDGRDVRDRRALLAGAARARARRRRRARRVGRRRVGRAERAVPALRLLGPRAARELLRLVPPARRGGAAL